MSGICLKILQGGGDEEQEDCREVMKRDWLLVDNCLKLSDGYMKVNYSILFYTCLKFSLIKLK